MLKFWSLVLVSCFVIGIFGFMEYAMVIGILEMILYLPESHSLKDKRQVVKSVKDKVHHRFNVAIAEVDDQDLWQKARLGVCSLGNDRRQVNGRLDLVINFIERLQVAVDIDTHIELLDY